MWALKISSECRKKRQKSKRNVSHCQQNLLVLAMQG